MGRIKWLPSAKLSSVPSLPPSSRSHASCVVSTRPSVHSKRLHVYWQHVQMCLNATSVLFSVPRHTRHNNEHTTTTPRPRTQPRTTTATATSTITTTTTLTTQRQSRKTLDRSCFLQSLWFDRVFCGGVCSLTVCPKTIAICCLVTVIGSWKVAKPQPKTTHHTPKPHKPHATSHQPPATSHTPQAKRSQTETEPNHSQAKPSQAKPSQTVPHHTTPSHAMPKQATPKTGLTRPNQARPDAQGHFQFKENVVDASASPVAALLIQWEKACDKG